MSDEINTVDAGTEQNTAEQSNMSVSEFANRRLGQLTQPQEEEKDQPVEAKEEVIAETSEERTEEVVNETEVAEQAESEDKSQDESENSADVLSQLDLDEMSEDDLRELSEKLGSRAVARFGELTAKRKAAEEQLKQLQSELSKKNPLETSEVANNPYSDINDIEGLQNKAKEVNQVIEWAEDILFNADGYGPDDVVTTVEDKELTKADVRKSLLNARKGRDKFLPAQLKTVQTKSQAVELKSAFDSQAKKELQWLEGEDNDLRKTYESMVNDNRFKQLKELADPNVGAQLDYLIAHAANSIYGRKPIGNSPTSPKLNPPKTGATGSSTSEKPVGKSAKALKDLGSRFKQSGNKNDFISLRTLQIKNR